MEPTVKQAIANAPDENHLPLSLTTNPKVTKYYLSDPVVWYTSTIIEGRILKKRN